MNIEELAALRARTQLSHDARATYRDALEAAAPELFAAKRRLEALEEAMRELNDGNGFAGSDVRYIRTRAAEIEKERSK